MVFLIWIILLVLIQAGKLESASLRAYRVEGKVRIDGRLDEIAWQEAEHITDFTQRELQEGEPASEPTEVAVIFDDKNLYIGIWCYDHQPTGIVAQKMKRDFDPDSEDNFKIVIDTYHDRRNGYLFVVNPNGARFDALIVDNGRQVNDDWDGIWEAHARVTPEGWFAEIRIPFSTLRFNPHGEEVWGINFERVIRRKREEDLWQGWKRDFDLEQVVHCGELLGINIKNDVSLLEIKPYGLAGVEYKGTASRTVVDNMGADLNYLITPTVKLNLTINTDFAQVESDRIQVNLTRFNLYYPEKREFFLEGSSYFDFGLGSSIRPFYSRRIGLAPDHSTIPILAGIRLLGKNGDVTLGGMSIQTAARDTIPSTNFTILRWKRDLWQESSVGIMAVNRRETGRFNTVFGSDFLYSTTRLFGDKNFSCGGAIAGSYTSDIKHKTGLAHRIFLDFPNDLIDFSAIWDRSGSYFNPETGFLRRESYQMIMMDLRFKPRPAFLPWIQRLVFKPFDFNYYIDDRTHQLQSLWSEFRPLGFTTRSGEYFEANVQRRAEKLTEEHNIHDEYVIPEGEYWFTDYELQLGTFSGRPLRCFVELNWGGYYNGEHQELYSHIVWRMNKYLSLSGDYSRNQVTLPEGGFVIHEFGSRLEFAFNPELFGSIFGQWNNDDEEILVNCRVNWIPRPGTDLFFVINQTIDTANGHFQLQQTTILTKFVWLFSI